MGRGAHPLLAPLPRLRSSFMLVPPLQPCPACQRRSVRLCEGFRRMPALAFQRQRLGGEAGRSIGSGPLLGEKSEDGGWHPERALLYLCTACRFARLSVSGLLRGEPSPDQRIHLAGREHRGRCRILVLHHDVQLCGKESLMGTAGTNRGEKAKAGTRLQPLASKRLLAQQSMIPAANGSSDLPQQENYAPAKWAFFARGVEVCQALFQKELDQAYAVYRRGSAHLP